MTALLAIAPQPAQQSDWSRETAPRADGSVSLIIADSHNCRWPVGRMHFCGAPVTPGRPYCERHCNIAYARKGK